MIRVGVVGVMSRDETHVPPFLIWNTISTTSLDVTTWAFGPNHRRRLAIRPSPPVVSAPTSPCRHRRFLLAPAPLLPPPLPPLPALAAAAAPQQRGRSYLAFSSYLLRFSRPFCSWLSSGRSSNAVAASSGPKWARLDACQSCGRCGFGTKPARINRTGRAPV